VVFGKSGGFPASLDVSTLDGTNGFFLKGKNDDAGNSVSAADINGDRTSDLIIGAPRLGKAYVVFGRP